MKPARTTTSALILDAAERLFARQGHDNTSMRQITGEAGVNLAAVNYHFGSKEQLVQAVFKRRITILNEERLRLLNHLEAQAGGQPLKPSQVVDAFFGPLVRHAYDDSAAHRPFVPLMEHSRFDPNGFIRTLFTEDHTDVVTRFRNAFQKALPDVPLEDILWRFHFMLGATSYAIMGIDALRAAIGLPADPEHPAPSTEQLLQRLMSFLLGGLRAPLPGMKETSCPSRKDCADQTIEVDQPATESIT